MSYAKYNPLLKTVLPGDSAVCRSGTLCSLLSSTSLNFGLLTAGSRERLEKHTTSLQLAFGLESFVVQDRKMSLRPASLMWDFITAHNLILMKTGHGCFRIEMLII